MLHRGVSFCLRLESNGNCVGRRNSNVFSFDETEFVDHERLWFRPFTSSNLGKLQTPMVSLSRARKPPHAHTGAHTRSQRRVTWNTCMHACEWFEVLAHRVFTWKLPASQTHQIVLFIPANNPVDLAERQGWQRFVTRVPAWIFKIRSQIETQFWPWCTCSRMAETTNSKRKQSLVLNTGASRDINFMIGARVRPTTNF